jgi:hypothetical protein
MENLKEKVNKLVNEQGGCEQVKILQEINKELLTNYVIKIDNEFNVYPIEVESYYFNDANKFQDTYVHKNKLQKNRLGKLYFHRYGKAEDSPIRPLNRGGIDICLSNSKDYYWGILIRSAWINNEDKPVCGPGLLTKRIVRHICKDEKIEKLSDKEISEIIKFEKESILFESKNDMRNKESTIFNATRVGIRNKNNEDCKKYYVNLKLRSLIELKEKDHPFKEKEKVVISYLEENPCIERTPEKIRDLLGSKSEFVLSELQKKKE